MSNQKKRTLEELVDLIRYDTGVFYRAQSRGLRDKIEEQTFREKIAGLTKRETLQYIRTLSLPHDGLNFYFSDEFKYISNRSLGELLEEYDHNKITSEIKLDTTSIKELTKCVNKIEKYVVGIFDKISVLASAVESLEKENAELKKKMEVQSLDLLA